MPSPKKFTCYQCNEVSPWTQTFKSLAHYGWVKHKGRHYCSERCKKNYKEPEFERIENYRGLE